MESVYRSFDYSTAIRKSDLNGGVHTMTTLLIKEEVKGYIEYVVNIKIREQMRTLIFQYLYRSCERFLGASYSIRLCSTLLTTPMKNQCFSLNMHQNQRKLCCTCPYMKVDTHKS